MTALSDKIKSWTKEGFSLYKGNFLLLVIVNLLAVIVSVVTLGFLAGPLWAGVAALNLRLPAEQETKPEIGDIFKGFDFFLNAFLLFLAGAVFFSLAGLVFFFVMRAWFAVLALLVLGVLVKTFVTFAVFLIVDKQLDFWAACQRLSLLARRSFKSFLPLIIAVLIATLLACAGAFILIFFLILTRSLPANIVAILLGSLATLALSTTVVITGPLYFSILAAVYRDSLQNISID